jgi:structural maintenance of chromosome 1
MLEPETFLPLDYIQAKPLKERLRNITSVRGVKLLYDVLHYNPPDIKRAVLFVTNNSLVCETPEDAMKVCALTLEQRVFFIHLRKSLLLVVQYV